MRFKLLIFILFVFFGLTASCGNGVCELGESCVNCSADCPGVQTGPQNGRYCCGDGTCQPSLESFCIIDCGVTTGERTTGERTTSFTTAERTTAQRTTAEQTTSERTTAEQTTSQRTTGEQTTAEEKKIIGTGGDNKKASNVAIPAAVGASIGGLFFAAMVLGVITFIKKRKEQYKKKGQTDLVELPALQGMGPFMNNGETTYLPFQSPSAHEVRESGSSNGSDSGQDSGSKISGGGNPNRTRSRKRLSMKAEDLFEIDPQELVMERQIGAGAYGIVYQASWRKIRVAVKTIKSEIVTERVREEFIAEAELIQKLKPHPNIVQAFGVCTRPGSSLCIITEFLEKGSLSETLKRESLSAESKEQIILGVSRGLLHLHKEGIVHRDLAARNILLSLNYTPKITDFGLSRVALNDQDENKTESSTGPIRWMSPESIMTREYSFKSDVWSFGVLMFEVLSETLPYSDLIPTAVAVKVAQGQVSLASYLNQIKTNIPYMIPIMLSCFKLNPEERNDMTTIVDQLLHEDD